MKRLGTFPHGLNPKEAGGRTCRGGGVLKNDLTAIFRNVEVVSRIGIVIEVIVTPRVVDDQVASHVETIEAAPEADPIFFAGLDREVVVLHAPGPPLNGFLVIEMVGADLFID